MKSPIWLNSVDAAVTVCDCKGIILYMNGKAEKTFASDGGRALLGKNLMACHPDAAREKILRIMESGAANTYTIEKNGVRKLVHQAPWYQDGALAGLVEFSIVIPSELPHFVRK